MAHWLFKLDPEVTCYFLSLFFFFLFDKANHIVTLNSKGEETCFLPCAPSGENWSIW